MNTKRVSLKLIGLALVLALICGAFCGCTSGSKPVEPSGAPVDLPVNTGSPAAPAPSGQSGSSQAPGTAGSSMNNPPEPDKPEGPDATSGATVVVGSVEEMIEAIAPNTKIVLKSGDYDITSWVERIEKRGLEDWNYRHDYVRLSEVYDGYEVQIYDVDGLAIYGEANDRDKVLICVDPRYAAIFAFDNCTDLTLEHFTAGHTVGSECGGDVLRFENCADIYMDDLDLYGCGIYGYSAYFCTNIELHNSYVHDCSYGPICAYYCEGEILFDTCRFNNNTGSFGLDSESDAEYIFDSCYFGPWESSILFYDDYIRYEGDCEFADYPGEYPDVDPDFWDVEPDADN